MSENNYTNAEQTAELMKYISDNMKVPVLGAGGGFAPIGTLNYYMGTVAPQGWLICDGTVYNIADYPEFATFIASNYGSTNAFGGNGTTTFAVPDCCGEFARMAGTNSHANQGNGATIGTHQDGTDFFNMLQWTESGSSATGSIVTYYSANDTGVINLGNKDATSTPATTNGKQVSFTGSKSDQNPAVKSFTGRPTNTSWNFIVKATVSGDANGHVYSTEEQIVGTWIDGKPIYEITVEHTFSTSITKDTPSFNYSIGSNDVPTGTHMPDTLVSCDVFLAGSDNGITITTGGAWDCRVWSSPTNDKFLGVWQGVDDTSVRTFTKSIITVRYTAKSL